MNERDAAHLVYQDQLEAERRQLYEEVDAMLESALLMQTWLLGDGHPAVTDTIMITVRMLLARGEHALAAPMLVKVWELRTGVDSTERLEVGHPREVECSLFNVGRATWMDGDMAGAVTLLEALFKSPERHLRNMVEVRALLAMAHITGGSSDRASDLMDIRIALLANVVEEKNMRPVSLQGCRFSSSDVLQVTEM